MKLSEVKILARELMASHGLSEKGWRFEFDSARVRSGYTQYAPKLISISRFYAKLNEIEKIKNTILHEIAHALVGQQVGHGPAWRSKAIAIGCNGERCTSGIVQIARPWQAVCVRCGDLPCFRFNRKKNLVHITCRQSLTWKPAAEVRS